MLLFKIAAVGFVAIAALAAGAYAYATRDSAPGHPSLVAGSMPPLIPVRDFYANTGAEWAYEPSHDGGLIAWYGVDWTKTVIRVKRTTDAKPFLTLSGVKFDAFRWHPHKNELIVTVEQRLWQVDPAKPDYAPWFSELENCLHADPS